MWRLSLIPAVGHSLWVPIFFSRVFKTRLKTRLKKNTQSPLSVSLKTGHAWKNLCSEKQQQKHIPLSIFSYRYRIKPSFLNQAIIFESILHTSLDTQFSNQVITFESSHRIRISSHHIWIKSTYSNQAILFSNNIQITFESSHRIRIDSFYTSFESSIPNQATVSHLNQVIVIKSCYFIWIKPSYSNHI